MQKRMLVVVERDAWVHRALADGAAGFELVECSTARAGLNACCALQPDCLLTAIRLNEGEGLRLIEAIRAQPGEVAVVPIVAMAPRSHPARQGGDDPIRVQALRAGADVVLQKPLEVVEVMAQVQALIAMAARVGGRRRRPAPADAEEPLQGDLEEDPVAGVLSMLELEQRSGDLELTTRGAPRRKLTMTIASGALVGGFTGTTQLLPLEALRMALGWEGRRFEFVPSAPRTPPPGATVGELLLEALRAESPWGSDDLLDDADLPTVSPRQNPPPPPVSRPAISPAPGRRLIESVVPSSRPDPRVE